MPAPATSPRLEAAIAYLERSPDLPPVRDIVMAQTLRLCRARAETAQRLLQVELDRCTAITNAAEEGSMSDASAITFCSRIMAAVAPLEISAVSLEGAPPAPA